MRRTESRPWSTVSADQRILIRNFDLRIVPSMAHSCQPWPWSSNLDAPHQVVQGIIVQSVEIV